MQILETIVDNGPFPTVRFLGEGGEAISVSLAFEASLEDAQLIAKAKVLLLHAAGFENPETGHTADRPEPVRDASYTLEYRDNGQVRDLAGLTFPTLDAVLEECRRSADDLWQDALSRGHAPVGWAVRARDAKGDIVATVEYEDIRKTHEADTADNSESTPSPL
ncbi:hypothetical protein MesoLj113c_26410 [Mesorhizobium sp. 113-3-9]|nr:hypothetical protein MesoLj113c_26410 [Mesorhizobium sp. 113-3-9]